MQTSKAWFWRTISIFLIMMLVSCSAQKPMPAEEKTQKVNRAPEKEGNDMKITSPDFEQGQAIPSEFTCNGENISPTLKWSDVPAGAKSLALVCDDPDAPMGTWTHWIVVNIPPEVTEIPENGPIPQGAVEITNSFGKTSYGGPCPPSGTHHYFFKLYALNVARITDLSHRNYETELKKHTIAQAE